MNALLLQEEGPVLSTTVLIILAILLLVVLIILLLRWQRQGRGDLPVARSLDREPDRAEMMAATPAVGSSPTPSIPPTPVVSHVPGVAGDLPETALDIPAAPDIPADVETVNNITAASSSQVAEELLSTEPVFPVEESDLELIEGIGPRIASLLREVGIISFAQLAATPVATLRAICVNANLRMADPTTWPEQARLAANGNIEGLQAFQARLRGGRAE